VVVLKRLLHQRGECLLSHLDADAEQLFAGIDEVCLDDGSRHRGFVQIAVTLFHLGRVNAAHVPEPVLARPWRPEDGPRPRVTVYPRTGAPALAVWSAGAWRYAVVRARHDWPDGRVHYQVAVDLLGDTTVRTVTYQWPQPGLRVAARPRPPRGEAHMPAAPPRRPADH
jgi:hypothetical protein